jgi:hypothetical protein
MKKLMVLFLVLFLCTPAVAANWADNLEMGGDVRFRWYQMSNMWDFNDNIDSDNWETFRLRTRIFAKAKVSDDISGFVRLANQTYGNGVSEAADNTSNKVFVDNAYITVKDFFGSNMTFQAGRMNLMYGSGFVLFDGNSQFASTSLYFDGAKLSIPLGDNAVLDGFYVKDEENSRDNKSENDITLGGAYLTAKCPVMGGKQELYVLNRRDESITKDIWMTGIRLSDKFENGLDYSGEFAYQFGDFNEDENIDQEAYGYKLDAGFTLKDALMSPRLFCGYMSLQGDDPDTDEKERWDVFYGGWPQFGDLLAWKYVQIEDLAPGYNSINNYDPNWAEGSTTTGEAAYSNISMFSAGIGAQLTKSLSAKFTYGLLTVDEPDYIMIDDEGNEVKIKNDDDFGDYYQLQAKYGYSKNLSFSVYGAMIDPGDAFITDDDAYELFVETNLKF